MKLKDLVSVTKNKRNNQTNLTIKKTKLKDIDMTEEQILGIEINKHFLK